MKDVYVFGDFEITKREIIASITIIAVMLLIGVLISEKISDSQTDKNDMYNKAIHVDSSEIFQYGMNTNVGNAFVYGDLKAVDTVTYPEIGEEYMYVEKVKEKYTKHTRTVKRGKTTTTQTYYTWDRVGSEDIKCNEISFLGIAFSSNKFDIPNTEYIDTIKESSDIRYQYYGTRAEYTGTIFTDLRNGTISDSTPFYNGMTIEETINSLESSCGEIFFWIVWILLTIVWVFGFYYLDNKWLE